MTNQQKYNKPKGDRVLGGSGIGYGITEACVENDWFVLISASTPASADEAVKRLQGTYPSAINRIRALS